MSDLSDSEVGTVGSANEAVDHNVRQPAMTPPVTSVDAVLAPPPAEAPALPHGKSPAEKLPPKTAEDKPLPGTIVWTRPTAQPDAVVAKDTHEVAVPPPARVRPETWIRDTVMAANGQIDLVPWSLPQRDFRIHEPERLSARPAVLVMLHGCRQTPEEIAEGTRLNEHADTRGWLVVYPDQSEAANKHRCWNWFDPANERGDGECALVVAMLAAVRTRYGLRDAPAFLAGMSAGGALASLLALRFSTLWSGVAIHSGLPYAAAADAWGAVRVMREGPKSLDAARALATAQPAERKAIAPVPAMIFHGAEDSVVDRRNADLLVRQFLGWNGHLDRSLAWDAAPLPPADVTRMSVDAGHDYIVRDYRRSGVAPVRECEVLGMSHAWSGGDDALPFNDELGPDGSAMMMEFFDGFADAGSGRAAVLH